MIRETQGPGGNYNYRKDWLGLEHMFCGHKSGALANTAGAQAY
jgi:hypothetical protein